MNEAIPSPVKGAPMRADWAARITDVCNQMVTSGMAGTLVRDGAGAFGNAPLSGNQRNRTTRTPLPFQVAWRTDVGESGGLAVYLPTDHLLMVDGTYVSIGGVTSINGVPDWFAIDDGNRDAAHVWLLVSKGSDQVGASVTCAESPAGDLCICLAEIVQPESESTDRSPTVRQSVVGALVLGLGGEGGSGNLSASGIVVTSIDQVTSTSDPDYAYHAYDIRIKRGRLSYDAATGAITVTEHSTLTQFLRTTPHTAAMDE